MAVFGKIRRALEARKADSDRTPACAPLHHLEKANDVIAATLLDCVKVREEKEPND